MTIHLVPESQGPFRKIKIPGPEGFPEFEARMKALGQRVDTYEGDDERTVVELGNNQRWFRYGSTVWLGNTGIAEDWVAFRLTDLSAATVAAEWAEVEGRISYPLAVSDFGIPLPDRFPGFYIYSTFADDYGGFGVLVPRGWWLLFGPWPNEILILPTLEEAAQFGLTTMEA